MGHCKDSSLQLLIAQPIEAGFCQGVAGLEQRQGTGGLAAKSFEQTPGIPFALFQ